MVREGDARAIDAHYTGRDGQDREVGMMAQAEFDKRADQRRDAEDMENQRTLHDEQMQKYGEDLRGGE